MFSDLDKSTAHICRKSFEEMTLDLYDEDTLKYSALYEELLVKKDSIDRQGYTMPALLPVGEDGIVNIRPLLSYDGVKFINMAYMTILGRVPEKEGITSLQAALSADSSREAKINLLKSIGGSPEAKLRGAVLTGFDSINVTELYKYSDIEFIENAYINILMRRPDAEGGRNYLSLLRSPNHSPAEVLYSLRHSPEGEKYGVEIIGLEDDYRKEIKRQKFMNIPVIGRCGKFISGILSANRRINDLRRENYYLRDKLYSGSFALDDGINNVRAQLTRRIDASDIRIAELAEQNAAADNRLTELTDQYEAVGSRFTELAKQSETIASHLNELDTYTHQIGDNVNALNKAHEEDTNLFSGQSEAITRLSEEVDRRSISYENSLSELDGFTHQIGSNVSEINKSLSNYDSILSGYVHEDKKTIQLLLAEVFSLKARINALEKGTAGTAAGHSSQTEKLIPDTAPASDVYGSIDYFDFENHFRGSREHIKAVQKIYIPYFEGKKNVLDLGCGRGEFTELLKENNIGVTGVDMYEPYVEYMKSLGLPAVLDDAVAYLSRQESTDGIFLGQVIEHITTDQIVTICNMAYEKLEDGCCLIMETPNPRSLSIYYGAFYLDPSHQKPVHPYTLKYIAEKAGFSKVDILYTDSSRPPFSIPKIKEDEPDFEKFNEAMQRVSELLYGSQDYAVIARK